jgi:hypothetical protein
LGALAGLLITTGINEKVELVTKLGISFAGVALALVLITSARALAPLARVVARVPRGVVLPLGAVFTLVAIVAAHDARVWRGAARACEAARTAPTLDARLAALAAGRASGLHAWLLSDRLVDVGAVARCNVAARELERLAAGACPEILPHDVRCDCHGLRVPEALPSGRACPRVRCRLPPALVCDMP